MRVDGRPFCRPERIAGPLHDQLPHGDQDVIDVGEATLCHAQQVLGGLHPGQGHPEAPGLAGQGVGDGVPRRVVAGRIDALARRQTQLADLQLAVHVRQGVEGAEGPEVGVDAIDVPEWHASPPFRPHVHKDVPSGTRLLDVLSPGSRRGITGNGGNDRAGTVASGSTCQFAADHDGQSRVPSRGAA